MSFLDDDTSEAHEKRIVRCRSCHARIVFLKTDGGKSTPVNADSVEPEDELFVWGRHESHFRNCPQANEWRKRR